MKIHQIVRTVETMLGWIFSERASLSYSVSDPLPGRDRIAVVRTITPTPPTHSLNVRHHCSVRGSTSSLSVIVSPVPVKPLMLSKRTLSGSVNAASVGVWAGVANPGTPSWTLQAISKNGSEPHRPTDSHPDAATIIP